MFLCHEAPDVMYLQLLLLIYQLITESKGFVTLSPPSVAPVCSGGEIELTCSVPGPLLTWSFQETIINGMVINRYPGDVNVQTGGDTERQSRLVTVNSVNFTYSRLSPPNALPLVSRLVISPVSESHNGTELTCTDAMSTNSSSSTFYVVNKDSFQEPDFELVTVNVTLLSEDSSGIHNVTVVLEWIQESILYLYSITVVPQVELKFIGSTRAQLILSYNILYNVSVVVTHLCGRMFVATFVELIYPRAVTRCKDIRLFVGESVIISDYAEPLLRGKTITFTCPPGMELMGHNMTTCMENGEWEPDPREVVCNDIIVCGPPPPPQNGYLVPYISTLVGATVTYVLQSTHQLGHQSVCTEVNVTAVCNREGKWEAISDDGCSESPPPGNSPSHDGRITIAIACTIAVFTIASLVLFIAGFLCRHFAYVCGMSKTRAIV